MRAKMRAGAVAAALALAASLGAESRGWAQDGHIEVPALVLEEAEEGVEEEGEVALHNIVLTAAKEVTTVQEAPAIVTVVTEEEIRDRGWKTILELSDAVPGWMRQASIYGQFPFPLTRGVVQGLLYLQNGVSLFDTYSNVAALSRVQPIETIKRVELITGPGGVLWGANSFLGIMNVVTKDADDVDGVEVGVRAGHGNGDRELLRGYAMAGIPDLLGGRAKLFLHTSFESYVGPGFEMPYSLFHQPMPQPNGPIYYGGLVTSQPPRSILFNFNGKFAIGSAQVYFSYPIIERHTPLGFAGFNVIEDRVEDRLTDTQGNLLCPRQPPFDDPRDFCLDKDYRSRDNRLEGFDRFVIGEYRVRSKGGAAGLSVKSYAIHFFRGHQHLGVMHPIPLALEGGMALSFFPRMWRVGGGFDGDFELPAQFRVLYGGESFYEWVQPTVTESRQGNGIESRFIAPYNLSRIPLPCPLRPDGRGGTEFVPECPLTTLFEADRTTFGGYVNPQWRPSRRLILDGGVRLQVAPQSVSLYSYPLQQIFSGSLVYNFFRSWHVKLNYAQGFRPPVFINAASNGDAIQIDGPRDIKTETSQAIQGEVNARLFRGERQIRELDVRADYSYTTLKNTIQIIQGRYENTGQRGIHSGEFLGTLYLKGGHRLYLGYTWLQMQTADRGQYRTIPNNWFHLGGIVRIAPSWVATSNLRVVGAMEDPNRIVEYRDHGFDGTGKVMNRVTFEHEHLTVAPHELVMDRLPPGAELTLGLTYAAGRRLVFGAWAYNAFNQRYYLPDTFHDYEPRLEFLPNPNPDARLVVNASYNY